jgi:hypothetical protein
MASVTPAAGEVDFASDFSGRSTHTTTVPKNPMPAQLEAPRIERIASVRILRGAPGWRGIAMRLANSSHDEERFELALTAGDGRSITIAVAHQDDAVALWRDCGRASGMPLLLETSDGAISEPFPQIGRLALGPIRIRRRHSFLNGRRPRFLVRRKTGRLAERPVVIAGERLTD